MRIVVGLSGGVDSSVAAYLLKQQGHEVIGLFMRNWNDASVTLEDECPWVEDSNDALLVAQKLGIPFQVIDMSELYKERIVDYMFSEYEKGRTPNPDILCNREVKFDVFLQTALSLGADKVATGHYARVSSFVDERGEEIYQLLAGKDNNKDQSYFLYTLSKNQVGQSLFPVGEIEKPIVRAIAEDLGLITAKKKDSTGICFIGERKFKDFLARYLPAQPGDIRTVDGEIIGRHEGLMYHTLGQRKGLGIGGLKNAGDEAWYVVDKDVENNELIVAQGHDHPRLFSKGLIAKQLHWVNREPVREAFRCSVKTRYRQTDIACLVEPIDDDCIRVIFDEPQAAVTPGQSAVFYLDEVCLGGGIIEERI